MSRSYMFAAPKRGLRYSISLAAVFAMVLAMLPLLPGTAQAATTELFFSEYVEGASLNKALEVYNGTGSAVDLAAGDYEIQVYFNGNTSAGATIDLVGTVADGDVFVVADDGAVAAVLVETDQTTTSSLWNGDDAIVLRKAGVAIDSFGQVGVDPGSQWTGGGANDTLRRKATVCLGDDDASDAFDAGVEWDIFAQDTFDGLGSHVANCDGGGPTILINEVDADTPGNDALEFVELYDGGVGSTALDGHVIVFYNGSDDASYLSFDLDGQSTDADGYFVLGNPGVANVDMVFDPGSFGALQNGADAVALHLGDAEDFPNDTAVTTTDLLDAIVYDTNDSDDAGLAVLLTGGGQVNEDGRGAKDNHSNQRCPNGSGAARDTSTFSQYLATPGEASVCEDPATEAFIHEIQGAGDASPLVGQTVIIEGIVVGDFQDDVGANGDLNGFHVQEEDADADGNALTSEGIFVFNGSDPSIDVAIGDLVRVEGSVSEFNGLTEMSSFSGITVLSSGNPLPTPASLTLPVTSLSDFEPFEGMSVHLPQSLVIVEYFNYDRFGEIVLSSERHLQPTAEFEPGSAAAIAAADLIGRDRITLDDGLTSSNPEVTRHPNGAPFSLANRFNGGDTLKDVTGVMDFAFGAWKVQPTGPATHTNANPRELAPEDVGGDVTVASFNVLNYYTTIDDREPGSVCFPSFTRSDCRGADSVEEFERQRAKIIVALAEIDADVVGLIEIENNVNDDAVIDLVAGLNDAVGVGTYDYVAAGTTGTDTIKVAFIYKPESVSLAGAHAILDDPAFLDPADSGEDRNRAALAQTFTENVTGESFTAVVNHFKSKSGSETDDRPDGICVDSDPTNDTLDCDQGDGQAYFNYTRTLTAQVLSDWLATDPTGSGDPDVLVLGDLNAYDKEDPIVAMQTGGYTDLVRVFQGESAYSYVFDGQIGYLDYGMANAALMPAVTDATVWHLNSDEPDILDYDTSFKSDGQDAIFDGTSPFRSSDHDPVIIGLNLANPLGDTEQLAADLGALLPTGDNQTDRRLDKAIERLDASFDSGWWTSDQTITSAMVFDNHRRAIAQLALIVAGGGPEADAAMDAILIILNADRQLAQIELIAAIERDGRASKIADAEAAMADAAAYAAAGLYVDAVNAYKAAWRAATRA